MSNETSYNLGILAFGSLIDHPGEEIEAITMKRIECETPFNVEFGRLSSTRGNAPTLIPVSTGGRRVKATIIVLNDETDIQQAQSILWRRERHKVGSKETYTRNETPTPNTIIVGSADNFMNVTNVLYTSIGSNITVPITAEYLAENAINSILSPAGEEGKDGIRYLLDAKNNNLVTELSSQYEQEILRRTGTNSLDEAIEVLDVQRRNALIANNI